MQIWKNIPKYNCDAVYHEIKITSETSNFEMYFGDEIMFLLTFSFTFYIPFFVRSDVLNIKMTEMVIQKSLTWTFYVRSTTIDYHTLFSLLCGIVYAFYNKVQQRYIFNNPDVLFKIYMMLLLQATKPFFHSKILV